MKKILFVYAILQPTAALAHLGHVADVAGHGHWIGVIAIGIAVGVAAWAGTKASNGDTKSEGDEPNDEPVEA